MKANGLTLKCAALTLLSAVAAPALAYEEDTHFQMTYIICRTAGFNHADAIKVAAVDQGMDDSKGTVANGGIGGIIPNVPEESLWHALDKGGNMYARGVIKRKDLMFSKAVISPGDKLFLLGVFFHYQQDTWAHRHHYDGDSKSYANYITYNTPFGHAKDFHQPDRPPFDPVTAILNFEDGLRYAIQFRRAVYNQPPPAFIANYQPKGGSIQTNWKDEGKYFHQLSPDGAMFTARGFLTDLIRAQIGSYKSSIDPTFGFRYTADEADLNLTRASLQLICDRYGAAMGDRIVIPTTQEKVQQGFTNMTTAQLLAAGMPND